MRDAASWAGVGPSPCAIAARPDFPFDSSRDEFRRLLLEFQADRRVEDVFTSWEKNAVVPYSVRDRQRLEALLREAGVVLPPARGTAAAG